MKILDHSKKLLVGVTAAGILTLGGGAAAYAATGPASSTPGANPPAAAHPGNHHGASRVAVRTAVEAAATTLGTTPQELREQLETSQQSLATFAGDRLDAVKSAVVAALGPKIDEAQSSGRITQERADEMRSHVDTFVDRFVNHVPQPHPAGAPTQPVS
ncbi:MAG: hypothetical protein WCI50_14350 [Actinomycetes bacterium]